VYNDIPSYDDDGGPTSPTYGANRTRPESYGGGGPAYDDDVYNQRPSRSNTYHGGGYGDSKANPDETFDSIGAGSRRGTFGADGKPSRPTAPKPHFKPRASAGSVARDQAVALFTFDAAQAGDLGFKKGDVITVIKRTEKAEDWWTGRIGGREGIFPRLVSRIRAPPVYGRITDADLATMSSQGRDGLSDSGSDAAALHMHFASYAKHMCCTVGGLSRN